MTAECRDSVMCRTARCWRGRQRVIAALRSGVRQFMAQSIFAMVRTAQVGIVIAFPVDGLSAVPDHTGAMVPIFIKPRDGGTSIAFLACPVDLIAGERSQEDWVHSVPMNRLRRRASASTFRARCRPGDELRASASTVILFFGERSAAPASRSSRKTRSGTFPQEVLTKAVVDDLSPVREWQRILEIPLPAS